MEKKELVFRKKDTDDKRALRVCLTTRADELLNVFLPRHNAYVYKMLSSLDKHEKETLLYLLKKLKTGIE